MPARTSGANPIIVIVQKLRKDTLQGRGTGIMNPTISAGVSSSNRESLSTQITQVILDYCDSSQLFMGFVLSYF